MTQTAATFCILCDRDRIPNRPPACDACRYAISHLLGDIGIYAEQIHNGHDVPADERLVTAPLNSPRVPRPDWVQQQLDEARAERQQRGIPEHRPIHINRRGEIRDPIYALLPSGAAVNALPIDINRVDLMLHARYAAHRLFARGDRGLNIDLDQTGHLPLTTALDYWVREWAPLRRESLPTARIAPMLAWLRNRVDWACDRYPLVDEFAAEMRQYRATMRGLCGDVDYIDYKIGVSCPNCHARALYRPDGNVYVECAECPHILSPQEYLARTKTDVVCSPCIARIEDFHDDRAMYVAA